MMMMQCQRDELQQMAGHETKTLAKRIENLNDMVLKYKVTIFDLK